MTDLSYLQQKSFTVILVYDDGTARGDWRLLPGVADWREDGCLFLRPSLEIDDLLIPASLYEEIRPVTPEISSIFGEAEYFLLMPIAPVAEDSEHISARFIPFE